MSNPLDTDAGSEMFASYENELKLVQADLNQKLDQIAEATGEQRKSAIRQAEQVLDEATELVRPPSTPYNTSKRYSQSRLYPRLSC
jgi:vesicle transport through interaction with t-SNAREs protein 1